LHKERYSITNQELNESLSLPILPEAPGEKTMLILSTLHNADQATSHQRHTRIPELTDAFRDESRRVKCNRPSFGRQKLDRDRGMVLT
jgi:hypothetical protein